MIEGKLTEVVCDYDGGVTLRAIFHDIWVDIAVVPYKAGDVLQFNGHNCYNIISKAPLKIAKSKMWGKGVRNRR